MQIQRKLQLPHATEVARWETRGGDSSESTALRIEVGVAEVRMIKHVESFRAELQIHTLGEPGVLDQRQIGVDKAGSGQGISAEVAKVIPGRRCAHRQPECGVGSRGAEWLRYARLCGLGTCHCVCEPLRRISCRADAHQEVGAQTSASGQGGRTGKAADAGGYVQGIAGLRLDNRSDFPARNQTVTVERQLVKSAEDEAMPHVEVGEPTAIRKIQAVLQNSSLRVE